MCRKIKISARTGPNKIELANFLRFSVLVRLKNMKTEGVSSVVGCQSSRTGENQTKYICIILLLVKYTSLFHL